MTKPIFYTTSFACAALMAIGVAEAGEGWYVRGDVGYGFDGEVEVEAEAPPPAIVTLGGAASLEEDWMAAAAFGYDFHNNFRLEGEISQRDNAIEPALGLDAGGDAEVSAAMLNLYYDFNQGGRYQPYVGIGAGAAQADIRVRDASPLNVTAQLDDTVFAYQALAGVTVGLTEQLDLDLGYRYFVADGIEGSGILIPEVFAAAPINFNAEGDYRHHAATIGLRWSFAAPAPAVAEVAPPPPAPPLPPPAICPRSDFVVYFEWDRADLNEAAASTIAAAVERARQCNVAAVAIVGHTDSSGSDAYNIELSARRAAIVRDALAAGGLARAVMTTASRGESELARATGDNVREPLNRRTAVTISFR